MYHAVHLTISTANSTYPLASEIVNTPSIDSVRVFLSVAAHGSITHASRALGYTPSAISQRLSGLEQDLGVVLFERLGNRLRISGDGEALIPAASEMLRAAESFTLAATQTDNTLQSIVVGGFPSGLALLVDAAFRTDGEQPSVQLVNSEDVRGTKDLRSGLLDVMLLQDYGVEIDRHDDLAYLELLVEPLMLISGRPDPTFASAGSAAWAIPTVEHVCGVGIRSLCTQAGFDPNTVADIDDFNLIIDIVRNRDIYSILPCSALPADRNGLHVQRLDGRRRITAAFRATERENPAITTFLEKARATLDHDGNTN